MRLRTANLRAVRKMRRRVLERLAVPLYVCEAAPGAWERAGALAAMRGALGLEGMWREPLVLDTVVREVPAGRARSWRRKGMRRAGRV